MKRYSAQLIACLNYLDIIFSSFIQIYFLPLLSVLAYFFSSKLGVVILYTLQFNSEQHPWAAPYKYFCLNQSRQALEVVIIKLVEIHFVLEMNHLSKSSDLEAEFQRDLLFIEVAQLIPSLSSLIF